MRKLNFILALGLLLTTLGAQAAKEVYTVYDNPTKTLTYYYDENRGSYDASKYPTLYEPSTADNRFSTDYCLDVQKIVVDASMANAGLTSARYLFGSKYYNQSLRNATTIEGLQYINTANVADFTCMFCYSQSLQSIDVSKFDTNKATTMQWMFAYCLAVGSLDVSKFVTTNVKSMYAMFYYCKAVKKLDIYSFNTSNVTSMQSMFYGCENLEKLDLIGWNMAKVTTTEYMFYGCKALTTIKCTTDLSKSSALTTSNNMFTNCSALVGGNGTTYDGGKADKTYARPDGGTSAPGYFTAPKKVYTVYTDGNKTLTYYCDDLYPTREGIVEIYDPNNYSYRFDGYNTKVLTIDIDESMADTSLTNGKYFFSSYNYQLVNATSIKHLEYINTTKTENVDGMFYGLQSITSLDISSFETQNMTVMAHMFSDCVKMTSLRLGGNFNTAKVTSLREMLTSCMALKAIDCTNMDVTKVNDVCRMFADNAALVTIWCNTDWSVLTNITNWGDTFRACTALKGGKGTTFNSSYIKNQYARPDGGPESETPGYFTPTSVLQDIKDEVYESLNALKKGENTKVDEIINAAKSEVNAYVWDLTMTYDENVADFDTEFSYTWYMDVKTAVQNQYELDQNLEKLYAAIADLTALRMFADNYLENAELVASINTDINNAYAVYNNPSATLAEVNTALKNATDAIESYKALMMPMAKEQLKADLNALLKEGDPQACKDIVAAAVAQVDEIIVWDNTKTAAENILALAAAGETLYNTTKDAVEKARQETGIDSILGSSVKDAKIIRNGQLYIQRGDELFNAQGARVK